MHGEDNIKVVSVLMQFFFASFVPLRQVFA